MSAVAGSGVFACGRLVALFHDCFAEAENTVLVGGAEEALYQPAAEQHGPNRLYFREDYFASALHEVAHWCIAGPARRKQVDFGYWYAPQGRNAGQQRAFEAAEVKPQALEWIFSQACAYRFRLSADNFGDDGAVLVSPGFSRAVAAQARHWQQVGLAPRAARFFSALVEEFGTAATLSRLRFDSGPLGG